MLSVAKLFIFLGSINALLVIVFGAFGAHALKARIPPETMEIYQTGIQYHFYHAIGLFIIAFVALHLPKSGYVKWCGWMMLVGIILFSGSLYAISLGGMRWLGMITPIGGTAFVIAWALLAIGILKAK
jgi:uncharacterized membrane protein YgdD (TMEM256/DUF423 family)